MSQHDYVIDNQSGKNFRTDLNNALQALATQNSAATEPTTTYPFMPWVDTSGSYPILKVRNAANNGWKVIGRYDAEGLGLKAIQSGNAEPSTPLPFEQWIDTSDEGGAQILKIRNLANTAWITLGRVDQNNFGLLSLTGGTLTGALIAANTDFWKVPTGTTDQRPSSPLVGQFRYNTTLLQFEGYSNGNWSPVGGGGLVSQAAQGLIEDGTITLSTIEKGQSIVVQGNTAAVTLNAYAFGNTGGWKDNAEILLIGNSSTNTVTLLASDRASPQAKTLMLNGDCTLKKYDTLRLIYNATLDLWFELGRNN